MTKEQAQVLVESYSMDPHEMEDIKLHNPELYDALAAIFTLAGIDYE